MKHKHHIDATTEHLIHERERACAESLRFRVELRKARAVLRRLTNWAEQDQTGAARDIQGVIEEAYQALGKDE